MTEISKISVDQALSAKYFLNFVEAARSFCSLIETGQSNHPNKFLGIVQRHLLSLYRLGLEIPAIVVSNDTDPVAALPDEEMKGILTFIAERVPFSYYGVILQPFDEGKLPEAGIGDLVDDLGDIYKDLKRGLVLFDMEDLTSKENAIWQLKFSYDEHWGEHCIEALQAIHHYRYENR